EEGVEDEDEEATSPPQKQKKKDDAAQQTPTRRHGRKKKNPTPGGRPPPLREDQRDCQADHEQDDERCRQPPSQGNDVEWAIRRCPCVHRILLVVDLI